jgi:hypothetical protein
MPLYLMDNAMASTQIKLNRNLFLVFKSPDGAYSIDTQSVIQNASRKVSTFNEFYYAGRDIQNILCTRPLYIPATIAEAYWKHLAQDPKSLKAIALVKACSNKDLTTRIKEAFENESN